MNIKPLTMRFRATTYTKAFILNAIVAAAIAVFAVEMRVLIHKRTGSTYTYINKIIPGDELSEEQIIGVVFFGTFIVAIVVYLFMYILFGYGGGLLVNM